MLLLLVRYLLLLLLMLLLLVRYLLLLLLLLRLFRLIFFCFFLNNMISTLNLIKITCDGQSSYWRWIRPIFLFKIKPCSVTFGDHLLGKAGSTIKEMIAKSHGARFDFEEKDRSDP